MTRIIEFFVDLVARLDPFWADNFKSVFRWLESRISSRALIHDFWSGTYEEKRSLTKALRFKIKTIVILGSAVFCLVGVPTQAADAEYCLMCHRHRFMGRIDENGKKQNYHVDELMYGHSVHRTVPCRDCHVSINNVPHDPVTQAIDCANECHIKPPFSQKKFSHEKIVRVFDQSVHKAGPDASEALKDAQPHCKFCHLNPAFITLSETQVSYAESMRRCLNCHQQSGVIQAYRHMAHRLRKKTSRSPQEIVELCAKCHQDKALMKKLNVSEKTLTAVDTYYKSIHGKLVRLGSQKAADCISCHATNSIHDIYKKDNAESTINAGNLTKTCRQCHEKTNSLFANVTVHPSDEHHESGAIWVISMGLEFALYGSVFGLMSLLFAETFSRRRHGVRVLFKNGSSWREKTKQSTQEAE